MNARHIMLTRNAAVATAATTAVATAATTAVATAAVCAVTANAATAAVAAVTEDRFICPFPACGQSFANETAAFDHLSCHEQKKKLFAPTPLPDSHMSHYWPEVCMYRVINSNCSNNNNDFCLKMHYY